VNAYLVAGRWKHTLSLALTVILAIAASSPSESQSDASAALREIVGAGRLLDLRWSNFLDYQPYVRNFYERSGYALAWIRSGVPTAQARTMIAVLQQADTKGLSTEDYDGPQWSERLTNLKPGASAVAQARFDAALTVCAMRYVTDLHLGRINPRRVRFNLDVGPKKHELSGFLERLVESTDIEGQLAAVEPPFAAYRRTLEALQHYEALAPRRLL
jgi:murein L,D-transpeptidase YcbB/YkuD